MSSLSVAAVAAARIERRGGLPCGACGRPHVATPSEIVKGADACVCPCCRDDVTEWLWELIVRDHPDLATTRRGTRVITRAAFLEWDRRIKSEIAELERIIAESERDCVGVLRESPEIG